MLRKVWQQIKTQTLIGWTAGWIGSIAMNALLQGHWDWKFWTALTAVLLLRVTIDVIYAWRDAQDSES